MVMSAKKAHSNVVVKPEDSNHYIQPPEERKNKRAMCWTLEKWMSGMKLAARAWEDDYAEKDGTIVIVRGKVAPNRFFDVGSHMRAGAWR